MTPQTNDFTIALWANFRSDKIPQVLMGSSDGGGDFNKWIFWKTGGGLQMHVNTAKTGGLDFGEAAFQPETNQWYHLAVVKSGRRYGFHVNGVEIGSGEWKVEYPQTVAPLTLGKAEGFGFDGLLDDIRFYTVPLSAQAISELATSPAQDTRQAASSDFAYSTADGAVTITKYNGPGGEVVIPKDIDGLPVKAIGDSAFIHRGDLTDVKIPDGVEQIRGCAFFNCSGLTRFSIPDSVTHVAVRPSTSAATCPVLKFRNT